TIISNLSKIPFICPERKYPILIGSRAAKFHLGEDFRSCESSDYDIIITPENLSLWLKKFRNSVKSVKDSEFKVVCELHDGNILEFELAKTTEMSNELESNNLLYKYPGKFKVSKFPPSSKCYVASVEALYELKRSHIYWPIGNWDK